jgi:hypothetical protein
VTVTISDRAALEALVVDNDDLERLEALLAQFNIFEALGAVRHELRHSDLLRFLVDPRGAHGLGDLFLRRLLQRTLAVAGPESSAGLSPVEMDVHTFDEAEVFRERANIDLLVLDHEGKLAVIVENKIDTGEHSNQLRIYWEAVSQEFPSYRLLGIYLTPDGDLPSDDRYVAVDYSVIATLVERLVETRASTLGPDVRVLLAHYAQMLRRHIVSDSEIAELCRRIYRKHRAALDLIYEHRPDMQQAIREALEGLVKERDDLVLDVCTKSAVRFLPRQWDEVPALREGTGMWTSSRRVLMFEFVNAPESLYLKLVVGPGPAATRAKLYAMATADPALFKGATKGVYKFYNTILGKTVLPKKAYEAEDIEELTAKIREQWTALLAADLPAVVRRVEELAW